MSVLSADSFFGAVEEPKKKPTAGKVAATENYFGVMPANDYFGTDEAATTGTSTITGKPVPVGPIGSPVPNEGMQFIIPSGVYREPRPGIHGDTTLIDPSKYPRAPQGVIQKAPGAATEYVRHLLQRTGLSDPGLVKTLLDLALLPFTLAGEAVDLPYRAYHGYSPGEGGVSPGQVSDVLPLLSGPGGGSIFGPLKAARGIRAVQAIKSPAGKAILKDLAAAAGRGETGMVSGAAAAQLKKLDMPSSYIKQLIQVAKEAEQSAILAPAGKPTVKVSQDIAKSLDSVLNKISIGESQSARLPKPSDLYRDYIDALNPLKKLLDKTVDAKKLSKVNPYELFRLLPGTWGKVDSFLAYKRFDISTYRFEGKSLSDILRPVKPDLQVFRAYYAARQALDLEKSGILTGFDPKHLRKVVKTLSPKFSRIADELTNYNNSLLRQLLGAGVINRNEYLKMVKFHKHYAPMWRVVPDRNVVFSQSAEETMRQQLMGMEASKPVRALKGSGAVIHDPLESVVRNTYLYLRAADKNLAMRSLIDLTRKDENWAKLFKKVSTKLDEAEVDIPDDSLAAFLREAKVSGDTLKALTPDGFIPKPNVIAVWENGKRTLYETHPDIVRVVKALDKEEIGTWVRILSAPARLLRAGAVLSPEFIARNPMRDQLSAFIFSKHGFVPGVDFIRGIAKAFKQDEAYWQWKVAGGEHAMLVSLDRVALQDDLARALSKYGGLEFNRPGWHMLNPVEALRLYSALGEKGTRLGEFLKAKQKLGTTKEALQKAAFASREVSLDFARAGAKGRAFNMLVAFWNAQVQGLDKLGRSFAERPIATSGKIAGSVTLPSIILAAVNAGDGRWSELPQWQKDLFWVIPQGFVSKEDWVKMPSEQKVAFNKEHPIWRIPKPFEIGVLFGSGPERFVEWLYDKDPRAVNNYLTDLVSAAAPGVVPTAALPVLEIWGNKSTLTGGPLVSKSQEQLLPQYQTRPDTAESLKLLSRVIADIAGEGNAPSPVKIDSLVRSWSGGLGHYALMLADELLEGVGILPKPIEPDPRSLEKAPVLRGFILNYPTGSAQPIRDFYEEYSLATKKLATARRLAFERGDLSGLQYIDKKSVALEGYKTAISGLLNFSNDLFLLPDIDPMTKRSMIDARMFEAIAIARQALQQADLFEKEGKESAVISTKSFFGE